MMESTVGARINTLLMLKFSSGSFLVDSGDFGQTVSMVGTVVDQASGRYGRCAEAAADGSAYLTIPSAAFDFGEEPFTIECFFRKAETIRTASIMGHYLATGNKRGWSLAAAFNSNTMNWRYSNNGTTLFTDSFDITTAAWHHAVLERNANGDIRSYFNGAMVNKRSAFGTLFFPSDLPLEILRYNGTNATGTRVDEIRIIKGLALYNSDAGYSNPPAEYGALE
jgi:hypothetical protein